MINVASWFGLIGMALLVCWALLRIVIMFGLGKRP